MGRSKTYPALQCKGQMLEQQQTLICFFIITIIVLIVSIGTRTVILSMIMRDSTRIFMGAKGGFLQRAGNNGCD